MFLFENTEFIVAQAGINADVHHESKKAFFLILPHYSVLKANWSKYDCSRFLIYCGLKSIYFHLKLSADIVARLGN